MLNDIELSVPLALSYSDELANIKSREFDASTLIVNVLTSAFSLNALGYPESSTAVHAMLYLRENLHEIPDYNQQQLVDHICNMGLSMQFDGYPEEVLNMIAYQVNHFGLDINTRSSSGNTMLMHLMGSQFSGSSHIQSFLDMGADPFALSERHGRPIHFICLGKFSANKLALMLSLGADPHEIIEGDYIPFAMMDVENPDDYAASSYMDMLGTAGGMESLIDVVKIHENAQLSLTEAAESLFSPRRSNSIRL